MLTKNLVLQALIDSASKRPADNGAIRLQRARIESSGSEVVVLADISSSMATIADTRTRIELLREALGEVAFDRLIVFSDRAIEIPAPSVLPTPNGSTAMHRAFSMIVDLRPKRTIVISDGEPNSEELTIQEAAKTSGRIDTIYCGPDDNASARAFLMRLAALGGGSFVACNVKRNERLLASTIRGMLPPRRA